MGIKLLITGTFTRFFFLGVSVCEFLGSFFTATTLMKIAIRTSSLQLGVTLGEFFRFVFILLILHCNCILLVARKVTLVVAFDFLLLNFERC